jgi:PAS domain S-box-containing protein
LISSLLSDYVYICRIKPERSPEIEWVSGAIENISGYAPEEIDELEHGWFSIIHPDDLPKIVGTMDYNYSEDKFYSNEYRLIDKSGKIRWVQDKSMCTNIDDQTRELTLLGATKEITERKKIEEDLLQKNREFERLNQDLSKSNKELSAVNLQLKESEKKYRNLIHNATIGVGISDGEKILFANQSLLDLFGIRSFEHFASKNVTDYVPEADRKIVRERLCTDNKGSAKEDVFRHEIIRSDGKLRTVQVVSNDIIFEGKKCKQSLITDITLQQEIDNALLQASNIFKNIQIGLFIYRLDDLDDDRSLRMVAVNPASSEIIGIPEEDIVGKKIDDIFPELRKNKIPEQFAEVVRTQIPVSFDDIYYEDRNINPMNFSVKVFPLPDQCVGISFENVSDRRKAERDLRIRNHELNSFVYKVSHDIRAPLSSIKGLINLSRLEKNSTDHLPRIEDRIDHLDGFIRDILSHSRNLNTAVVVEKIDLEQLINNWFSELKHMSAKTAIIKSISISGVDFYSDKTRLSEIIRNLISNAIKYHDATKEQNLMTVTGKVTKKKARLVFEDNGIGIGKQYLKDIFKMFYRATEEGEGSGIGLYIVKQSLENIGGKVNVKSKIRSGSTFTIEIPNLISKKIDVL